MTFDLPASQLALWNADMQLVVEPGLVEVMVGSSSADIRARGSFEITESE